MSNKWQAKRTTWVYESPTNKASPTRTVSQKAFFLQGNADGENSGGFFISDVNKPLKSFLKEEELESLCLSLPKIELHAHLSGSVRESTLKELLVASGGLLHKLFPELVFHSDKFTPV